MNKTTGGNDLNQTIRQLLTLQQTVEKCRIGNDSVRSKLLHVLGRTYWYSGNLSLGLAYTRQAIAINSRRSPTSKMANLTHSYYNSGRILFDQMRYPQALLMFDSCILVARRYPAKYASGADAYARKSHLYSLLGDYDQALRSAELGYNMAQLAGDGSLMVKNIIQQAQSLLEVQKYAPAQAALLKALDVAQAVNARDQIIAIYTQLADVSIGLGLRQKVLNYYKLAYNVSLEDNNRTGSAQTLTNMGVYYRSVLHNNQEAIRLYQDALRFADDPFVRLRILNNIGYASWQQRYHANALNYYQQALCAGPIRFTNRHVVINPDPQAIQLVANKENLLSLIQDKADTWLDWGKTTGQRSHLQHALETYQLADQMIDFMRWEHTGTGSKLYWRQKTRGLYERAIETCYRLGDTEQAYRFFEKSRAAMLSDKLNELGAHEKLTPAQLTQEDGFRQRLTDLQTQLGAAKPDTKAYNETRLQLSAEQERFDGFVKQLEQSNPAYYRYKYDNTTRSLADVQHWLGEQSASLVSYFVGDSALYVLGVTNGRAQLLRQPVAAYQKTAGEFRRLLSDPAALNRQFSRYQALAFALYRQLLAPLKLPEGRVVVSPDGFFLPFEGLSQRSDAPDWLVNHYAFSYAYSAGLLLKERPPTTPDQAFFGMAPVAFRAGLSPLAGSDAVLRQIGEQVGSATLLTGGAATRRAFREQAPHARIIQLFTHADAGTQPGTGAAGKTESDEPVLYFADSTLRLSEITGDTPFQAELLVLSACKTGVGVNQQGEGVFSLARGFAAVGVPSVLTTLWSVDNKATYRLTELFYKHLTDGYPKDVALQRAKGDFLKTASRAEQLPTNWAGLILVGNADPLPTPTRWPYVAGGSLLLAGIGWATQRRRKNGQKEVHMS